MKVGITNKSVRCIMLPSKTLLVPGFNLIDSAVYKSHSDIIEKHKELIVEKKEMNDSDLSGLNVKKAAEVIESTNDQDLLAQWKQSEEAGKKRAAVLKAIEVQLKKIDAVLIKKDKDSGEQKEQ